MDGNTEPSQRKFDLHLTGIFCLFDLYQHIMFFHNINKLFFKKNNTKRLFKSYFGQYKILHSKI